MEKLSIWWLKSINLPFPNEVNHLKYLWSNEVKKFSRCRKLWDFLLLIRIDLFQFATIELNVRVRFSRKVWNIFELESSFFWQLVISFLSLAVVWFIFFVDKLFAEQFPRTSFALWLRLKTGPPASSRTFFLDLHRFRKDNFRRFKFGEVQLSACGLATNPSSHEVVDAKFFDLIDLSRRKLILFHDAAFEEVGGVDDLLLETSPTFFGRFSLKTSESQRLLLHMSVQY